MTTRSAPAADAAGAGELRVLTDTAQTPTPAATFSWTDAALASLREQWAAGVPTATIGRALGCGKNAVIGKARRLGLQQRPAVVRRGEGQLVQHEAEILELSTGGMRHCDLNSGILLVLGNDCHWLKLNDWSFRIRIFILL
jgi:hypothetical protein